jgi:DNA-binding SARP family transcriptional activator
MAMLRIELLGGLELIGADGAPISISARKVAALAAYLAMVRRPQVVMRLPPCSGATVPRSRPA